MISKLELCIVGDGVETVVAVDQAGQTLLDDVEEWVKRGKGCVFGFHDELPFAQPTLSFAEERR